MKRTTSVAFAWFASTIFAVSMPVPHALAEEPPARSCGPLPDAAVQGQAWAIDGGALALVASSGKRFQVKLWGIDAPPLRDVTTRVEHVPGVRARVALDERLRIAGRGATCSAVEWDGACRLVAACEAAGNDLAGRLLVEGYAQLRTHQAVGRASFDRGRHYAETEEKARAKRAGLWLDWLGPKSP